MKRKQLRFVALNLKYKINYSDIERVNEIKNLYQSLSDSDKDKVYNSTILDDLINQVNELNSQEIIYNLALKLNKLITNDADYVKLNELDNALNCNDEVMSLSYKKDMACVKYSDLLKIHNEKDQEVVNALKELNIAKSNLDQNPLVKEYNHYYSKVKQMMFEVNSILFSDFTSVGCR